MSPDSRFGKLPVHGFVLAGGQSSRMGRDKALLSFHGIPLIEIALQKLQAFCIAVSIAGSREDLKMFAPIVTDRRQDTGPAAGIETALAESVERWILAIPVDVPLLPAEILRSWAQAVVRSEQEGVRLSYLRAGGLRQPACCMLHRSCRALLVQAVEKGERKLGAIFQQVAGHLGANALWVVDAEGLTAQASVAPGEMAFLFGNLNTPEDLAFLEQVQLRAK